MALRLCRCESGRRESPLGQFARGIRLIGREMRPRTQAVIAPH
ncbi:hypothetical protein R69927_04697 [Paraburkholderia domus]|jgi:hypothetical protein|uniref:Uncharacterized protein n=1 Tax=Paraburkholderia domus TaxID=2793075 RepID=A0A9N8MPJ6_9BURK|nr:hypothetical protein R70006_06686 [Paraburkholderia domus]CAE6846142.1 hypothetical protein R70199_00108 [Paraburkholderia domus]CAE6883436.1 hypothetical protein R70211_02264 [Paraburkholderia domus]CAE6888888.1 hypothetical protein R69927_04697 [Paraburkholderia domus]CAE6890059.1 hypothetical protein R75471_02325 [Paraburkholderia domus]